VGSASSRNSNDFYDFYGFGDFYDFGICRILESPNDYWLLSPIFLFIVIYYLDFLVTLWLSGTGPVLALSGIIAQHLVDAMARIMAAYYCLDMETYSCCEEVIYVG
jgi:hypothetical protein